MDDDFWRQVFTVPFLAEVIWFWVLFGGICTVIGARKGIPFQGFFCGFIFGPLGIVIMLLVSGNRKPCPFCLEKVHEAAAICPHCRQRLGGCGLNPFTPARVDCPRCQKEIPAPLTRCPGCGWALGN